MNFVLDTNIILLYLRDKESKNYIEKQYGPFKKGNDPIISIVTVGEIRSIARRSNWGSKRLNAIKQFLKELVIVDIRFQELIDAYAEIDTFSQGKHETKKLENSSRNMGKNDLWIAATTLITKSNLITTDNDFNHLHNQYFEVIYIDQEKSHKK